MAAIDPKDIIFGIIDGKDQDTGAAAPEPGAEQTPGTFQEAAMLCYKAIKGYFDEYKDEVKKATNGKYDNVTFFYNISEIEAPDMPWYKYIPDDTLIVCRDSPEEYWELLGKSRELWSNTDRVCYNAVTAAKLPYPNGAINLFEALTADYSKSQYNEIVNNCFSPDGQLIEEKLFEVVETRKGRNIQIVYNEWKEGQFDLTPEKIKALETISPERITSAPYLTPISPTARINDHSIVLNALIYGVDDQGRLHGENKLIPGAVRDVLIFRKGKTEIKTRVKIPDNLPGVSGEYGSLTRRQKDILDAVYSLYKAKNYFITVGMVHSFLEGNNDLSQNQEKELTEEIEALTLKKIEIDATEEIKARGGNAARTKFKGYFIPAESCEVTTRNGAEVAAWYLLKTPVLLSYAEVTGQINQKENNLYIAVKEVITERIKAVNEETGEETTRTIKKAGRKLKSNPERCSIRNYLLDKIDEMNAQKAKPGDRDYWHTINLTTLTRDLQITINPGDRKKTARIIAYIESCLEYWVYLGHIHSYSTSGKSFTITVKKPNS